MNKYYIYYGQFVKKFNNRLQALTYYDLMIKKGYHVKLIAKEF